MSSPDGVGFLDARLRVLGVGDPGRPRRIPPCGRSCSPSSPSSSSDRCCGPRPCRANRGGRGWRRRSLRWFSISRLQPVEIAPGAVLDQRTPQVDELLRRRRRRLAGQPLAHHQRDRLLDRRIGAVGDLVELAAVEAVVEHGGEILGDAGHAPRADRLDAGLLDRLEHGARLLPARHAAGDAPWDRGRRA